MREWGTECCRPRWTLEGSTGVKRTWSLCKPCGHAHYSTTCLWLWPQDLSLWALLDSVLKAVFGDKCLPLHYLENLNSFALWKRRKTKQKKHTTYFYSQWSEVLCYPTRGQTANEISGPFCRLIILSSVGGLELWTKSSLQSIGNLFQGRHLELQTWEDLITSQR